MGLTGVVDVLLVVLRQLLDALLAPPGHADQRQRPVLGDDEQRLHIQGGTGHGNRGGNAAAAAQGLQVVHHELLVHEAAGLLGPSGQLGGRHALLVLHQRLVDEQPLGHAGQMGVHDVQLEVRVLGENLIAHDAGGVERGGQPAGERQVHRRRPLLGRRRERVGERLQRHLGRRGLGALAHGPVKGLGRHGLEQVVLEGAPVDGVGELHERDAWAPHHRGGQIAAGIDDQVAFRHRASSL